MGQICIFLEAYKYFLSDISKVGGPKDDGMRRNNIRGRNRDSRNIWRNCDDSEVS
jgi:hypothetical protein